MCLLVMFRWCPWLYYKFPFAIGLGGGGCDMPRDRRCDALTRHGAFGSRAVDHSLAVVSGQNCGTPNASSVYFYAIIFVQFVGV